MTFRSWFYGICLGAFVPVFVGAQTISVSGRWDLSIGVGDLPTGTPGQALNTTYASSAGVITLSFTTGGLWRPYRVDVRRQDGVWISTWTLSVRRTGDGTGFATISGGTTYQAITTLNQQFFTGTGWYRSNVPLQYQLTGISTTETAQPYTTTVFYTITAW